MKFQKKKIIDGINKLYKLHTEIKNEFRANNSELKNISKFKQFLIANIKQFTAQRDLLRAKSKIFTTFSEVAVEFYSALSNKQEEAVEPAVGTLMKSYFKIMHQFYQTQSELEVHLRPINTYCEELKSKKRGPTNYGTTDAVNNFAKHSSQLLKPNISIKNFKKIKIEDYQKSLVVILKELGQSGYIKPNAVGLNIFTNSILNLSLKPGLLHYDNPQQPGLISEEME